MAAAGVLKGKFGASYPAVSLDVEQAGETWIANNDDFSNAYVDGNLVTAPAWSAHPDWINKFLSVLSTKIEP
ncbi:MAG: DJ-1/PfpI family protein [Cyanobacteria bacterium J06558_2]